MYTNEKHALILLSLLKAHGVKKIVISPGSTNIPISGSVQNDDFFEVYSSVDERSAAYIACGLAERTGEMVALSCTGATASRNYLSGLTEAYYRKLPLISITSFNGSENVGHLVPQNIDRSVMPKDTVKFSVDLPIIKNKDDEWSCNILINQALIEAQRDGGGPVHINLSTNYMGIFDVKTLPEQRMIKRFTIENELPILEGKKIAVFVGSHKKFTEEEKLAIELFCHKRNAIVMCDHTSSYTGKYRIQSALITSNYSVLSYTWKDLCPQIVIHIGEVSGDYFSSRVLKEAKEVWRVSPDGKLRDTGRKLKYIYEGSEVSFFKKFTEGTEINTFHSLWESSDKNLRDKIPDNIPFSNIWLAHKFINILPEGCSIHLGILNSLRSWNFFKTNYKNRTSCNVGGFGIDGCLSTAIGASLIEPDIPHFVILGDLAFFYDINSLANRFRGGNIRILLINNGCGVEFNNSSHIASKLDFDPNEYIAAGGHFNSGFNGESKILSISERAEKSLAKAWCEKLGFKYYSARSKEDLTPIIDQFIAPKVDGPIIVECFTDIKDESKALEMITNLDRSTLELTTRKVKNILPNKTISKIKSIINKK